MVSEVEMKPRENSIHSQKSQKLEENIVTLDQYNDEELQLMEECKPNILINQFIMRPGTCLCISFFLCFVLAGLAVLLKYLALNDLGDRDFLIWDHPATKNYDMWKLARDYRDEVRRE